MKREAWPAQLGFTVALRIINICRDSEIDRHPRDGRRFSMV
jgi:hypothetical protein